MNEKDAIQELWQSHEPENEQEKTAMWMQLVREKRSGFEGLVRARNQSEYMVTLIMGPALAVLAGKAKFPVVQAGYGLLSATMLAFAAATWLAHRQRPDLNDGSLRHHLEALIDSYDRRLRYTLLGKIAVGVFLSAGVSAVILGKPGIAGNGRVWAFLLVLLGSFGVAQWVSYRRAATEIRRKRDEAARMLRELPEERL